MGTHGVGAYSVNSKFSNGNLVFYEKAYGLTATGNILKIGTTAVQVGDTAQAVDFSWYATPSLSAIISAGGATLTLVGITSATNKPLSITDDTASTTTTSGALKVSGGVGIAKGLFVGEVVSVGTVCQPDTSDGATLGTTSLLWSDLFLASTGVINWAANVTLTHSTGLLTNSGALTVTGAINTDSTTDTSSTTSGSIQTDGGVGVALALWVGTTSRLVGAVTASSTLGIAGLITSTSVTGFRSNPTFVPDSTYSNYALAVGWKGDANELLVTFGEGEGQNLNLVQMNVNATCVTNGPSASSQMNLMHSLITHDTKDMANLRLKCTDFNVSIGENVLAAYVYQGEMDFTKAGITVGSEATVMGLVMNAGSNAVTLTGGLSGMVISMQGTGMPANSRGIELRTTAGTGLGTGLAEGIRLFGTPLIQVGIVMGSQTTDNQGPQFAFFFPTGAGTYGGDIGPLVQGAGSSNSEGSIKIKIGADTKYLRYYAAVA